MCVTSGAIVMTKRLQLEKKAKDDAEIKIRKSQQVINTYYKRN